MVLHCGTAVGVGVMVGVMVGVTVGVAVGVAVGVDIVNLKEREQELVVVHAQSVLSEHVAFLHTPLAPCNLLVVRQIKPV